SRALGKRTLALGNASWAWSAQLKLQTATVQIVNRTRARMLESSSADLGRKTVWSLWRSRCSMSRGRSSQIVGVRRMFQGKLIAIYIHGPKGEDLRRVDAATVLAGRGIDGDRYCRKDGVGKPDQEITLVEMEAVEALARECSLDIDPVKVRRNLLT